MQDFGKLYTKWLELTMEMDELGLTPDREAELVELIDEIEKQVPEEILDEWMS